MQSLATLKRVLFELMDSNSSSASLEMSLDLLVARASLDMELRQQLLSNPEACCIANGIHLPEGTQVVFTPADSPLIIKEIPLTGEDSSSLERIKRSERELATSGFNMGEEAAQTTTKFAGAGIESERSRRAHDRSRAPASRPRATRRGRRGGRPVRSPLRP